MWECKLCNYKNNNSSKKCHGDKCKGLRGQVVDKTKRVLDNCPKCDKETIFTFERNKMVEIETFTPEGGKRVKTRVEKRFRCTECQSLCRQTGRSKQAPELEVVTA